MDSLTLNAQNPYAMKEELLWIRDHVASLPDDACVVMIGAGPGVMALACFEGNPKLKKLHVVELNTVAWLLAHLEAAGIGKDRVETYQGYSWDVGDQWRRSIDFLIVDGDHSFEAVSKDIAAWTPHMKRGSAVFFHDCYERDGGFLGEGEWKPSEAFRALTSSRTAGYLQPMDLIGISAVCLTTRSVIYDD